MYGMGSPKNPYIKYAQPADLFPEQYNLNIFKARVNKHLLGKQSKFHLRPLHYISGEIEFKCLTTNSHIQKSEKFMGRNKIWNKIPNVPNDVIIATIRKEQIILSF